MGDVAAHNIALLITGTIVPNSNFVAHTNVEQRRKEYMDSLVFYRARFPKADIFFLENSSHDIASDKPFLELLDQNKISLMKFPVSDKFSEGKGYQEFEMLDAAISRLTKTYDHVVKLTGRYQVENILELCPSHGSRMTADSHKKLKVTQTNVFIIQPSFYKEHLLGSFREVNDEQGRFVEHVVYDRLVTNRVLDQVQLFRKNPVISGFSGSYGGTLRRNKYKMMMRNVERKLLRFFGFHQFLLEY